MAAEPTTSKPNFFILLGLNPNDPWDDEKFKTTLEGKRSEWARKSNSIGSTAMEAKRNLALYDEIRTVMLDQAKRDPLAAAAKKELEAGKSEKIAQFERQLDIAVRRGFLSQSEVDKFIAQFKDVLSERDIRSRIKVPIRTPVAQPTQEQQLDPTTVKAINEKLKLLQKQDLYDLLGMPDMTSSQELSKAAQLLYEEMQKRQPKTPEVTLKSELSGHAKIIFKTEEMRRKYNESRRLSKLIVLLEEFEKTVNIAVDEKQKGLYAGQVALFLERAGRDGWSQEEARSRLQEYAKKRNWFLEVPTIDMNAEGQRCGYCKALNTKGREFCAECNKELRFVCPDCDQPVRADEVGCGKCGFPVGNRYRVDEVLADCRDLLSKQQLTAADTLLKSAESAWTPKKPDKRLRQIQECRAELQRLMQAQQQSTEQLREYISKRHFFAARDYLLQLRPDAFPDREVYQQRINSEITQAQALLRQARATTNADQKFELSAQALRICADFREALDLLSTAPPTAPRNLQAKIGAATVSLQWESSPTRNVSYKIVRKPRSQPVSVKDGQLLATVTGRVYDDTQPEIGVPTFYAVFAAFEEITSTDAATLQRPIMLFEDVKQVKSQINSQLVELSWQAPPHVHNIVIVRKEKMPPNSIQDGTQLTPLDMSHVVDRNVRNDSLYFYSIYCQFKDFDGHIVTSTGVTISATPETPPETISSLSITSVKTQSGYEVKLSWAPPSKGQAVILRSLKKPDLTAGEVIHKNNLRDHGNILQDRPGSLTDIRQGSGFAWYTPIVILQEMAYVGVPQRFAAVDDVSGLKYQNIGTAIRLNWTWPENCQEVMVAYSYSGWPQLDSTTVNAQKVTRTEYEHRGFYDIKGTQNCDHYIIVAAIIKQGNDQIMGSGIRVQARLASKMFVTYEIKASRSLFGPKKYMLQISSRTAGTLPSLLLISKQGRLPLRKEEGEPLLRLEGPLSIESVLEFELPNKAYGPRTFGKLYLENDDLYAVVTIHHPSEEKLRLA